MIWACCVCCVYLAVTVEMEEKEMADREHSGIRMGEENGRITWNLEKWYR